MRRSPDKMAYSVIFRIMKRHLLLLCLLTALPIGLHAQTAVTPVRVACVGDSITEGAHSTLSYPKQLQTLLGAGFVVKNFGVGGRTLLKEGDHPYWKEKAYTEAQAFQPNFVIIMLGTNDTKPQNWKFKDNFAAEYKELVESFKNLDSKPFIFVCRPPPIFGPGNYGINEPNLQVLMPIIDQVAQDEHAAVLDMHAPLLPHPETEADRIHPNATGDGIIAKVVADALTKPNATP
jgi:lysophospholipase L1-like esterase